MSEIGTLAAGICGGYAANTKTTLFWWLCKQISLPKDKALMVARVKKPGPVSARKAASQDLQKSFRNFD